MERKTLYDDMACLCEFGYDIQKFHRNPVECALVNRDFEEPELLLLADAVQSSRFLTKRKADSLVKKLDKLGGRHVAADLKRRMHVEGRIKSQNEFAYYAVDAIQRAIAAKKKVEFRYFKYDENKKKIPQHDGATYAKTPPQLVYMDDACYLITWNDKHAGFANYRVDRMQRIEVRDQDATHNDRIAEFDIAKYEQRCFNMFAGDPVAVTLRVRACAMSAVVDRFGADVASVANPDGTASVHTTVIERPTFYGWLAQFGGDIVIEKPASLRGVVPRLPARYRPGLWGRRVTRGSRARANLLRFLVGRLLPLTLRK